MRTADSGYLASVIMDTLKQLTVLFCGGLLVGDVPCSYLLNYNAFYCRKLNVQLSGSAAC
ncbi:hypothetical protein DPMN_140984 [Dreissena polymorpha]|uniref:DNA-directed RNA polymerase n=1 Tax=Dreissena polymorpha TaxID=45954 RepID=A0A9D4GBG6_DREPO|nr:hypothetical protein DPMN_140984 [Dreissena polymorpha]